VVTIPPLQHLRTKALSLWWNDEWPSPLLPLQLEVVPRGSGCTPRKLHCHFPFDHAPYSTEFVPNSNNNMLNLTT